jgi:hypothetical protein
MRAIGLVLLSIAIMALLLTDADAKRRSSAQGSQATGASHISRLASRDAAKSLLSTLVSESSGECRLSATHQQWTKSP